MQKNCRDAMQRLSYIANSPYYGPGGDLFGDEPIHYLVGLGYFLRHGKAMIVD